jgi:hypothetical protein
MQDDRLEPEPLPKELGLIELLASWEPLPEEDSMPEIERPPAEPVTCFDDWVDEEE